jgi:hypothetical protein
MRRLRPAAGVPVLVRQVLVSAAKVVVGLHKSTHRHRRQQDGNNAELSKHTGLHQSLTEGQVVLRKASCHDVACHGQSEHSRKHKGVVVDLQQGLLGVAQLGRISGGSRNGPLGDEGLAAIPLLRVRSRVVNSKLRDHRGDEHRNDEWNGHLAVDTGVVAECGIALIHDVSANGTHSQSDCSDLGSVNDGHVHQLISSDVILLVGVNVIVGVWYNLHCDSGSAFKTKEIVCDDKQKGEKKKKTSIFCGWLCCVLFKKNETLLCFFTRFIIKNDDV